MRTTDKQGKGKIYEKTLIRVYPTIRMALHDTEIDPCG